MACASPTLTGKSSGLSARVSLRASGLSPARCVRTEGGRHDEDVFPLGHPRGKRFFDSPSPPHPRDTPLRAGRSAARPVSRARLAVLAMAAKYDYDLVIIGCGVGGHGAALHAVESGLKVAVLDGNDVGGTCVNRGCVPSKALLAASGRIRDMRDAHHLKQLGITARPVARFLVVAMPFMHALLHRNNARFLRR